MQISGRFAVAVHILACIDYFQDTYTITSDFIATSVNTNPVIIRQIISLLKAAGLVEVSRGKGGMKLSAPKENITLYDIYMAVESVKGKLFRLHPNPNPKCQVGKNIHSALGVYLDEIQASFEENLKAIKLSDIISRIVDDSQHTQ